MSGDNSTSLSADRVPPREDVVLDLKTCAAYAGISFATLKREIAHARGPKLTRPSPHRVGVRLSHALAWLAKKTED